MQLNTLKEKEYFLTELHKQIQRIYKQNLTRSDIQFFTPQPTRYGIAQRCTLKMSEEKSRISGNLPKSISLEDSKYGVTPHSLKAKKLELLIEIYNAAENACLSEDSIDLDTLFDSIKYSQQRFTFKNDPFGDVEKVLKMHRRQYLRGEDFLARFLRLFFGKPQSSQFLEKYQFFNDNRDNVSSEDIFRPKCDRGARAVAS